MGKQSNWDDQLNPNLHLHTCIKRWILCTVISPNQFLVTGPVFNVAEHLQSCLKSTERQELISSWEQELWEERLCQSWKKEFGLKSSEVCGKLPRVSSDFASVFWGNWEYFLENALPFSPFSPASVALLLLLCFCTEPFLMFCSSALFRFGAAT